MTINDLVLTNNVKLNNSLDDIKLKIKQMFGYDISYMKINIKNGCYFDNGKPNPKMNPYACGGNWQKNKSINVGDLDHLEKVSKFYNMKNTNIIKFQRLLTAHELSHEIYKHILTVGEKEKYKRLLVNFTTVYIDSIKNTTYGNTKLDEEKFCEYIASKII